MGYIIDVDIDNTNEYILRNFYEGLWEYILKFKISPKDISINFENHKSYNILALRLKLTISNQSSKYALISNYNEYGLMRYHNLKYNSETNNIEIIDTITIKEFEKKINYIANRIYRLFHYVKKQYKFSICPRCYSLFEKECCCQNSKI